MGLPAWELQKQLDALKKENEELKERLAYYEKEYTATITLNIPAKPSCPFCEESPCKEGCHE